MNSISTRGARWRRLGWLTMAGFVAKGLVMTTLIVWGVVQTVR